MLIVHLIARLNDGGPARVLAALGAGLAARGHRVLVLSGSCDDSEPDLADAVRAAGVEVERVPGLGRRVSPTDDLRAFVHVLRRLRQLRPDLLHTHTAKAGLLGRWAARLLGLPCLHTYHGHVLDGYFRPAVVAALRLAEQATAGPCHHHSLTPGQVLDLSRRHRIGRRTRWHCLPVPVPPVAPLAAAWQGALRGGPPVVGFLGRLVAVKDARLFLDAVAELARSRPVRALVCGDGPQRASLEAHARALGLDAVFTGFVPAGEALAVMDVLLMSSRNEGQPLVAVEAAWCRVPVAAPRVGGLADMARWGGVEAAEREPAALAAAVARLLADPAARAARLAAASRLARRLRPDSLLPCYESMYRSVARRR